MTKHNLHDYAKSTDEAMGKLRELLPEKRRKDAVLCVEYVMTASPDWWWSVDVQTRKNFFLEAKEWLADKYGKENIIVSTIHNDEKTPHLSAFVVPITADGRLSAKEFIGNRQKMSNDQTTFADKVKHLGLERGIEGSKAQHQRIKQHYGAIEQADKSIPTIEEQDLKPQSFKGGDTFGKVMGAFGVKTQVETPKGVVNRINKTVKANLTPTIEKAAESVQNKRRAKEMEITAKRAQRKLEALEKETANMRKIYELLHKIPTDEAKAYLQQIADRAKEYKAEQDRENAQEKNTAIPGIEKTTNQTRNRM